MDITSILISLALGAVAGYIAGFLMNSKGNLLRNIIIGIVGGFLGGWIFSLLNISFAGYLGVVVQSAIGACVLIIICRIILGK